MRKCARSAWRAAMVVNAIEALARSQVPFDGLAATALRYLSSAVPPLPPLEP